MPELAERWTRPMVLALPDDGKRYELFDGELLVTPAPDAWHQLAALALVRKLDPYVRAKRNRRAAATAPPGTRPA